MWSKSIEILNPAQAIAESLERERAEMEYRNSFPVLYRSTPITRFIRFIRRFI